MIESKNEASKNLEKALQCKVYIWSLYAVNFISEQDRDSFFDQIIDLCH